MIIYKLRDGYHVKVPVHLIGSRIDELEAKNPKLSVRDIIADARDPASPLHPCFTWDEQKAAEKCRYAEALRLQRCYIRIEIPEHGPPIVINPANSIVKRPDPEDPKAASIVVPTDVAMGRENWREQVLRDTIRQINGLQARLRCLEGISPAILKALEMARKLVERAAASKAKAKVRPVRT